MGHVFLGPGHSIDFTSIMLGDFSSKPVQRYLTNCDREILWDFYPLYDIKIDNNFTDNTGNETHGKVIIDDFNYHNEKTTVPFHIKKSLGQSISLTAINQQTDNQNHQMIWYTGENPKSKWEKKRGNKDLCTNICV